MLLCIFSCVTCPSFQQLLSSVSFHTFRIAASTKLTAACCSCAASLQLALSGKTPYECRTILLITQRTFIIWVGPLSVYSTLSAEIPADGRGRALYRTGSCCTSRLAQVEEIAESRGSDALFLASGEDLSFFCLAFSAMFLKSV